MFVKVSWKEQRMVWNKSTWPSTQPYSKKRMVSTRFIAANRFSAFKPDHYQAVGMLELPIYLPPPLSLPPSPFLTSFGVQICNCQHLSLSLSHFKLPFFPPSSFTYLPCHSIVNPHPSKLLYDCIQPLFRKLEWFN